MKQQKDMVCYKIGKWQIKATKFDTHPSQNYFRHLRA